MPIASIHSLIKITEPRIAVFVMPNLREVIRKFLAGRANDLSVHAWNIKRSLADVLSAYAPTFARIQGRVPARRPLGCYSWLHQVVKLDRVIPWHRRNSAKMGRVMGRVANRGLAGSLLQSFVEIIPGS